jgi:hypothetical protein
MARWEAAGAGRPQQETHTEKGGIKDFLESIFEPYETQPKENFLMGRDPAF